MPARPVIQGAEESICGACGLRVARTAAVTRGSFALEVCPRCATNDYQLTRAFAQVASDLRADIARRR